MEEIQVHIENEMNNIHSNTNNIENPENDN